MDDNTPANEPNEPGLNKIDLSQLQSFNFGTQWTEVKPVSPGRRERDFDRGDRRDRRDGPGAPGAQPRDRRAFRKPAGPGTGAPSGAPASPGPDGGQAPGGEPRRFDRGPGGPRREFRGEPRGEFRGEFRGDRRDGGGQSFDRAPYISPYFVATCYPEDTGFAAIVKAVRASCRTFQLFEITKAVLEKNDRFVIVLQRAKAVGGEGQPAAKPGPLYMSMPDHLPFDTEDAAVQHALSNNLGAFFDMQEVEVDPPKGSYPIINKCGVTGELLGPPNYHRYQQILQQHYAAKIKGMSFDRFRDSIVSVREPEVAAAWLEKMKKAVRYTWKPPVARTPKPTDASGAAEVAPAAEVPVEAAAPAVEPAAVPAADAPAESPAPAEAAPVIAFDSIEEARLHLLTNARDRVVRTVESVRFHGKNIEKLPPGEIQRALEGHVERQRRFPLDTANALRGRLRREGFTIFKKGSRGVSYVCAVKRRFRVPGQVFSESISALIDFIEKHPMAHVKDLPKHYLGFDLTAPAAPAAPVTAEPATGSTPSQAPFAALTPEQAEKLRKMSNDLRWLVMEGYVTEFSDGKLFAPPVMAPQAAKKAESGEDEHDPVDFPDAPAPIAAPAAAEVAPAAESAPVAEVPAPEEPKPEAQA
ncbi:hypothetical protein Verru16b_02731 [Lacunisphaera limnophila]|uniref:Uncharacterized protein n=1 Tax=Lacunisphaera limnophila TaxID=1838286 RepID=A0A1D8AXM9_9BACT|nr:hypothetical protein [Lacunisphaera limnophila]AOS45646.1 hypothetical protein Verru16b_02731 [Lacunisphaera limnophila]